MSFKRFCKNNLDDFQALDHHVAEVLQLSQQIIGRQARKSSLAHISKSSHLVEYIQDNPYFTNNEHYSSYSSKVTKGQNYKNHCCARDDVEKQIEEIDEIFGESNLIKEPSSTNNIHHKALDCIKIRKEIRQASKEVKVQPRQFFYKEYSKQDIEAREEGVIKAANYYLDKNSRDSNVQFERLLKKNLAPIEEEFVSTYRHSLDAPNKSTSNVDETCYHSTFNTNKQQDRQKMMLLPFGILESCKSMNVCDKSMSTTSLITPTIHSKGNRQWFNAKEDRQWFYNSEQLDSKTRDDFVSIVGNKGTWKYGKEEKIGGGHLDSTKLLQLDGGLPMSTKNSTTTTIRQQPNIVDSEQYPFSTKENLMNKLPKIKGIYSIQIPTNCATHPARELRAHDLQVPILENMSYTKKLAKGDLHKSLCLEDGMRQLSSEDMLLALENKNKILTRLNYLSSNHQFDVSCNEKLIYKPEQYLSRRKYSMSLITTKFASSFLGGLNMKNELTTYSAILASFEEDYKEDFEGTNSQASSFDLYFQKSNQVQRRKILRFNAAIRLLSSNTKCQKTKDKYKKSPRWMCSLNVRKPTKWHLMSITHTRPHASIASLINGTTIAKELRKLAIQNNTPKDTILATIINKNFNRSAQKDFDCGITTTKILKNDSTINYNKKIGNYTLAPVHKKITGTKKIHDDQSSYMFSTKVNQQIANKTIHISKTTTSSEQASIYIEPFFSHSSNSNLNQWIHGCDDLACKISLPKVLTMQENHCIPNKLVAKDDLHFNHLQRNSTLSLGLDHLISEVIHEWVENCSTPFSTFLISDGSEELHTMNLLSTCSCNQQENKHKLSCVEGHILFN